MVLDVVSGEATPLLDNWQGQAFNSPNDVCVGADGSIWFTDPDAGAMQARRARLCARTARVFSAPCAYDLRQRCEASRCRDPLVDPKICEQGYKYCCGRTPSTHVASLLWKALALFNTGVAITTIHLSFSCGRASGRLRACPRRFGAMTCALAP